MTEVQHTEAQCFANGLVASQSETKMTPFWQVRRPLNRPIWQFMVYICLLYENGNKTNFKNTYPSERNILKPNQLILKSFYSFLHELIIINFCPSKVYMRKQQHHFLRVFINQIARYTFYTWLCSRPLYTPLSHTAIEPCCSGKCTFPTRNCWYEVNWFAREQYLILTCKHSLRLPPPGPLQLSFTWTFSYGGEKIKIAWGEICKPTVFPWKCPLMHHYEKLQQWESGISLELVPF